MPAETTSTDDTTLATVALTDNDNRDAALDQLARASHKFKRPHTKEREPAPFKLELPIDTADNTVQDTLATLNRAILQATAQSTAKRHNAKIRKAMGDLDATLNARFTKVYAALEKLSLSEPDKLQAFFQQASSIFKWQSCWALWKLEPTGATGRALKYTLIALAILLVLEYAAECILHRDPIKAFNALYDAFGYVKSALAIIVDKTNWQNGRLLPDLLDMQSIIETAVAGIDVLIVGIAGLCGAIIGKRDNASYHAVMGSVPSFFGPSLSSPKKTAQYEGDDKGQETTPIQALNDVQTAFQTAAQPTTPRNTC